MKRMLILGASGFIGRHVVEALSAADVVQTVAVARSPLVVPAGVESRVLDASQVEPLAAALRGVDGVVNCVSGSPATIRANADALVRAAARQPSPPRIVHLSSMAVYGEARGVVDETAGPGRMLDAYASAKLDAERMLRAYPRAVILRPGCVYGPGSARWSLCIARLLKAQRIGDLGPRGEGTSNLIHVSDVVEAILRALRSTSVDGQCFNLAAGGSPNWNRYFSLYSDALGLDPPRRIPAWSLWLEGTLLAPALYAASVTARRVGMSDAAIPSPISCSMLRLWRQPIQVDSRKAQTVLKLSWTPLQQGLSDTAQWIARSSALPGPDPGLRH